MILFNYIARKALVAFVAALVAVIALYLVVDFAENASIFRGAGWVSAVVGLYANRAAVAGYQIAPAAMLLAAAVTASGLRKSREYTAMRALGLGPWRVVMPVMAVAAIVGMGLAVFDDAIVVDANRRAEEIMVKRFGRYGSWRQWHEQKRWFRGQGGRRIYNLEGALPGGGFAHVSVLEVSDDFRLTRRIDAEHMVPGAAPGDWVLDKVEERTFTPDGRMELSRAARRTYHFEEDPQAFEVQPGQPSQMRRPVLAQQIRLRRRLGLPVKEFELEWHNKIAYPLAGFPAGLLALGLALRRDRKGHLTASLVEAVLVSLVFWAVQGVAWSLGHSGALPAAVAAWLPDALFLGAGAAALKRFA